MIRLGSWGELGAEAYRIRHAVFVVEQGVPIELEHDAADFEAVHALFVSEDGTPCATGRLLSDGHIGRVAVLAAYRGLGYGRQIMQSLIAKAADLGHQTLILNAQTTAQSFYEALGFEPVGEIFMEASIAHIEMRRQLGV